MSEYRNYDDEWLLRSDNYCKHVSAMTGEKLHSKADIAAELAYRDDRITKLETQLPKWISVDERLPEHHKIFSDWVLGKNNKFNYPKVVRLVQCGGSTVWQDTSHACVIVDEWMPLPPKRKDHE